MVEIIREWCYFVSQQYFIFSNINLIYILYPLKYDKRYGTFLDVALIDDLVRAVSYNYDSANGVVAISVPHFWNYVGMLAIFIFYKIKQK